MNLRATFRAAQQGDEAAEAKLMEFAVVGDKDAEAILLQLTRENMAAAGEDDFKAAFTRVAAANPTLHEAYLNANGVKSW